MSFAAVMVCCAAPRLCFGANSKQAKQIETWIDIGAIVVEVGPGVVAAIRGGEVLGKVNFSKPLAKTQAPSVNPVSAGGKAATNTGVGGTNIRDVDPSVANNAHGKPPYDPAKPIQDFEADGGTSYVRIYVDGGNQQGGRWMMKSSDIEGLTPQQIQDKFDLPATPTHVTDVTPPQGTTIRTGAVNNGNFGGSGGGTQFELQGRIPDGSFANPRPLQ